MLSLGLYKTLVRPHVEYCSVPWRAFYKKDKELLGKIQHIFTKLAVSIYGKLHEERSLGLWTLGSEETDRI